MFAISINTGILLMGDREVAQMICQCATQRQVLEIIREEFTTRMGYLEPPHATSHGVQRDMRTIGARLGFKSHGKTFFCAYFDGHLKLLPFQCVK